jgi:serine/threonine protein kinase
MVLMGMGDGRDDLLHNGQRFFRMERPVCVYVFLGHIKVTDFGIATALTSTTITHTNSVLGSVHYLSPEQARGGLATMLTADSPSKGILPVKSSNSTMPSA